MEHCLQQQRAPRRANAHSPTRTSSQLTKLGRSEDPSGTLGIGWRGWLGVSCIQLHPPLDPKI